MIPIKAADAIAPRAEDLHRDDMQMLEARSRERAMEQMQGIISKLASGEDFPPVVFGKIKGDLKVGVLEEKNGMYVVPEWKAPSRFQLAMKRRRVKNIVKRIDPILRRDIGDVTEEALMRKSTEQLKELEQKLKKGKDVKLRNRVGCIFLEVDDQTLQI